MQKTNKNENPEIDFESNDAEDLEANENNFASPKEIIEEFENLFSKKKNVIKALINFANKKIYDYTGSTNLIGRTAYDIVMDSIEKILIAEKRKWDKVKNPNFEKIIFWVVLSEIRNDVKKLNSYSNVQNDERKDNQKNKVKHREKPIIISLNYYGNDEENSDRTTADKTIANEYFLTYDEEHEIEIDAEELLELLKKELDEKNDVNAYIVLEEKLKGKKNKEIAKEYNISVKEVENAYNRIKRLAKKIK